MTTTISNADLTVVQGGSNATTRPATTQNPPPATKQEIQAAGRDFSEAMRNLAQQRVNAAQIERAAHAGAAGGIAGGIQGEPVIAPTPPTPPAPPGTFTIQGPDGTRVFTFGSGALDHTIPREAVTISVAFFLMLAVIIVGLPIARAIARRMDRRAPAEVPNEISSQLTHLNQAVDAIALEVERISEGQRFTTRLISEQKEAARPLSSGANR